MDPDAHDEDETKLYSLLVGTNNPSDTPNLILYTTMRNEVMAGDINGVKKIVEDTLLARPETARSFFQALMFLIQDYDDDPRELYDIKECRSWFQSIDRKYPFLIYFIPCSQYTRYVGSQHGMAGSRLSVVDLSSFFAERDQELRDLSRRIEEPYVVMKEKLRRAFWDYSQVELNPW